MPKRPSVRHTCKWEDNIKTGLKIIWCEGYRLDSSASAYGPIRSSCEHSTLEETSGPIKIWEISWLDELLLASKIGFCYMELVPFLCYSPMSSVFQVAGFQEVSPTHFTCMPPPSPVPILAYFTRSTTFGWLNKRLCNLGKRVFLARRRISLYEIRLNSWREVNQPRTRTEMKVLTSFLRHQQYCDLISTYPSSLQPYRHPPQHKFLAE